MASNIHRHSLVTWLVRWGPVALCMAGIFWLSSQPKLPEILDGLLVVNGEDYTDKLKHFFAYAVLGVLLWRAITSRRGTWRHVALCVLLAAAYGLSDEYHQLYVPGRSFDLLDLAADALGALTAAALLSSTIGGATYGKRRRAREEIRSQGQEAVQPGRDPERAG